MNSTKLDKELMPTAYVWEICKFWILLNQSLKARIRKVFERYVNFEFYKTMVIQGAWEFMFKRYVNFEFYKTVSFLLFVNLSFEKCVNVLFLTIFYFLK